MSLAGKVAIITGASSGIGAATAIAFASEGCSISITGRNVKNLENIKSECIKRGLSESKILLTIGDVTDHDVLDRLVTATIDKFSKLDILINNAGMTGFETVMESTMEQVETMFATNFKAPFRLAQLCVPHLKKSKGNIVNVSSIVGLRPMVNCPVYSASKAALTSISDCMASELAPEIRVNCINPGGTRTAIFTRDQNEETATETFSAFENIVYQAAPLERMADPSEIADSIMFLASDKAKYITGEKLVIDGGMLCGKKQL